MTYDDIYTVHFDYGAQLIHEYIYVIFNQDNSINVVINHLWLFFSLKKVFFFSIICCLPFQIIFSYIFIPFAVLMGIDLYEAKKVATLLGLKIFTNEILAFMDLGQLIRNNEISVSQDLNVYLLYHALS